MADDQARLYSLIVRSTPEQVLLERMRLHGFWPPDEGLPPEPADEAAERARIEAELATLQQQLDDPNYRQALEAERRRRWEESKARRAARKLQRQQQADACREADRQRRASSIVHAGVGVSAGLHQHSGDPAKLAELGLPLVQTPAELAAAMQLSLPKLRWLTFHRRGATLVHYHRYEISKKTGGVRLHLGPQAGPGCSATLGAGADTGQAAGRRRCPRLRARPLHPQQRASPPWPSRGVEPGPARLLPFHHLAAGQGHIPAARLQRVGGRAAGVALHRATAIADRARRQALLRRAQ
jgi:hypothetical protein